MQERKGRNGGTLKSMEKGETLNPNGRPKKLPELDILLADVLGSRDENGERSEAKAVLEALLKQAKKGNVSAATAILNRAYGMPLQRTENKNTHEITGETKQITPDQIDQLEAILGNGTSDNNAPVVSGKQAKRG